MIENRMFVFKEYLSCLFVNLPFDGRQSGRVQNDGV